MTTRSTDRRAFRRSGTEEHGIVSASVRPGHHAAVIDVSAGGALVDTGRRLLPGAVVDLLVEKAEHRATLRGRVVRCAVVQLRSASVCYRAAIAFDRHLPWFAEVGMPGYGVPDAQTRPARPARVDATPGTL